MIDFSRCSVLALSKSGSFRKMISRCSNRSRGRQIALGAVLVCLAAIALERPNWWGYLSPTGRVRMSIGAKGIGIHHSGRPVALNVLTKCILRVEGWIPPYSELHLDANCALSAATAPPPRFQIAILGSEPATTPQEFAQDLNPTPLQLGNGEALLARDYFPGYVGIDETAAVPHAKAEGSRYPANVRFVAVSSSALIQVNNCLLGRKISSGSERFYQATCFGSGMYRGVIFDAQFDLTEGMTERSLSEQVQAILDGMLN